MVLAQPEPGALDLIQRPLRALAPDEVLGRVRRAGICGTDLHIAGWNEWASRDAPLQWRVGHLRQPADQRALLLVAGTTLVAISWANVPWIAVFDPVVTESATCGYYVVYLYSADTERLYPR